MKKILMRVFVLALALIVVFQTAVLADGISLFNNNTRFHNTGFDISSNGIAMVDVEYLGYENITTGATITVKIEKRNLLVFWKDIVEETYTVSGVSYYDTYTYQLDKTGTYRCTVEYVIHGTGGADDVITFEDTKTYE